MGVMKGDRLEESLIQRDEVEKFLRERLVVGLRGSEVGSISIVLGL